MDITTSHFRSKVISLLLVQTAIIEHGINCIDRYEFEICSVAECCRRWCVWITAVCKLVGAPLGRGRILPNHARNERVEYRVVCRRRLG